MTARDELSMTDRIQLRHDLQVTMERARLLRNAVEPTGLQTVKTRQLTIDLDSMLGTLLAWRWKIAAMRTGVLPGDSGT